MIFEMALFYLFLNIPLAKNALSIKLELASLPESYCLVNHNSFALWKYFMDH